MYGLRPTGSTTSCHSDINHSRHHFPPYVIQGGPKNWHHAVTLPNINRFLKLFHYLNQEKICNNTITKDPTAPKVCRYTTLEMSSVLKATILYALTSSNINRFSKFYLLILLPVPSDVVTYVIGIWAVFFESFVCL